MEDVVCRCRQCNELLGYFLNIWTKIGGRYVSPIVKQGLPLQVEGQGDVRVGETETLVEGCQLQDICCSKCKSLVGLECLETPINHVLAKDQVLLRLSAVSMVTPDDDTPVELTIVRTLKLKAPRSATYASGAPNDANDEASYDAGNLEDQEFAEIQADLEAQRGDIDRLDTAGYQIISAFNEAVSRIDREVDSLRGTSRDSKQNLKGLQDDLTSLKTNLQGVKRSAEDTTVQDRHEAQISSATSLLSKIEADLDKSSKAFHKELSGLRSDVQQTKKTVEELKMSSARAVTVSKDQAKELAALRAEMKQLRRQVEDRPASIPAPASRVGMPSREVEILENSINRLQSSVAPVESLRMGYDLLKGRVERLETQSSGGGIIADHHRVRGPSDPSYEPYQTLAARPDAYNRRKRPASSLGTSEESPSKRTAVSSDNTDSPLRREYGSPTTNDYDFPPSSPPQATPLLDRSSGRPKSLPTTKSGSVDKRYLKRGTKKTRDR